MNTNKCHIHVLLQLYVKKNAGTILFLNDFPDNSLMHLGRNDCNFRAYCTFGKSEITKINLFHFGPKTAKSLNKAKERHFKQDFCMSYTGRIILVYFFIYVTCNTT